MKLVRKIFALATCFILLLTIQTSAYYLAVFADSMNLAEQKVYSHATLDDAFADNRILIMLTNEASLSYLETGTVHFPELQYKSARNLSTYKEKQVRNMVAERDKSTLTERLLSGDPNADEIAQYAAAQRRRIAMILPPPAVVLS